MTENEIRNAIFRILKKIAPESNPSTLAPDQNIREALDIDSFDALNFFVGLDEELGIDIPEKDYGKLNTLVEMTEYLHRRKDSPH